VDAAKYLNRVTGHALVLGGSGGLGAEIVRALAASGASAVTVTYGRNQDAAAQLVAELQGARIKDDERENELSKIWVRRFAEPHEIAAFAAFLAGSGASYAYGQNFMVDGGYR